MDTVLAGTDNDVVFAGDDDDHITAGAGDDFVEGGLGDDTIFGNDGQDIIWGGLQAFGPTDITDRNPLTSSEFVFPAGLESADAEHPSDLDEVAHPNDGTKTAFDRFKIVPDLLGLATVEGLFTDGRDFIRGGDQTDWIFGGGDQDDLDGEGGDDYVDGGANNDLVQGGADYDVTRGGTNDDIVHGNDGIDVIYGDAGSDHLFAGLGHPGLVHPTTGEDLSQAGQRLFGDAGIDFLYAFAPDIDVAAQSMLRGDELRGGPGGDWLYGNIRQEILIGDSGNDTLLGDFLIGPTYATNSQADTTGADDQLFGGSGEDKAYGGGGNDVIIAGADSDWLEGQDGSDSLFGGAGIDMILLDSRTNYTQFGDNIDGHFGIIDDDNATDILLTEGTDQGDVITLSESEVTVTGISDALANGPLSGDAKFTVSVNAAAAFDVILNGGTDSIDQVVIDLNTQLAGSQVVAERYGNRISLRTDGLGRDAVLEIGGANTVARDELSIGRIHLGSPNNDNTETELLGSAEALKASPESSLSPLSAIARFTVSINGGPETEVEVPAGAATLAALVTDVNQALANAGLNSDLVADTDNGRLRLMTVGLGAAAELELTAANAVTVNELHLGGTQLGVPLLEVNVNGQSLFANWRNSIDGTPLIEQFRVSGLGGDDRLEFVSDGSAVDVSELTARSDDWVGVLDGGPGHDTLLGSGARDRLDGGIGSDVLFGFAGNDRLWGDGGSGNDDDHDILFAGAGNDDLLGGSGSNQMFAWSFDPDPDFTNLSAQQLRSDLQGAGR